MVWHGVSADRRTSISLDCRSLDAQDPAAVEARADNEDYNDQPTPPSRLPPSPLPPPAPTDSDLRSRDVGMGVMSVETDRGNRRQEQEVEGHGGEEQDLMRKNDEDLWARTTDSTTSTLTAADNVDIDNHCKYM